MEVDISEPLKGKIKYIWEVILNECFLDYKKYYQHLLVGQANLTCLINVMLILKLWLLERKCCRNDLR